MRGGTEESEVVGSLPGSLLAEPPEAGPVPSTEGHWTYFQGSLFYMILSSRVCLQLPLPKNITAFSVVLLYFYIKKYQMHDNILKNQQIILKL